MPDARCARALLAGLLLSASTTRAAQPGEEQQAPADSPLPGDIPARGLEFQHSVLVGRNPGATEVRSRIGYRLRLGQNQEFLSLGGLVRLSPGSATAGLVVDWQPIAVFNLRALVEGVDFFHGQLRSYDSPLADYSNPKADAASAHATTGWRAMLKPTLQSTVGPIRVQSITTVDYRDMGLRAGDSVWYEYGPDSLLPDRGWTLTEEVNLVHAAGPLKLGTTFRYFLPLYLPEHFRPGEQAPVGLNANMRLGLLAAYTFFEGGASFFRNPSVFASTQWHLLHPYRTGIKVSQAIPFVVLGFSFQQSFVL